MLELVRHHQKILNRKGGSDISQSFIVRLFLKSFFFRDDATHSCLQITASQVFGYQ